MSMTIMVHGVRKVTMEKARMGTTDKGALYSVRDIHIEHEGGVLEVTLFGEGASTAVLATEAVKEMEP